MVELEQDILGELQAIFAAAADVGDRLDLGPRVLAGLAKRRLGERLSDQEALGLPQPRSRSGRPPRKRWRPRGSGRRAASIRIAARNVDVSISLRLEIL